MGALDFYSETIGLPPVQTGVPPPERGSKKKKRSKKPRYGKGFHKTTPDLVPGESEDMIDLLTPFTFILHVYYCLHLDPPVEQDSESETAVMKTLCSENCQTQLLRSMKTKFQVSTTHLHDSSPRHLPRHTSTTTSHDTPPRQHPTTHLHNVFVQKWTNKSLTVLCVEKLYEWVRAGPTSVEDRIDCVKSLGSSENDEDNAMCQSLIVEALVQYSKGKENAKVFPYGDAASKQTSSFVQVASPTFSITLAAMYPFIVNDKSKWTTLLKNCSYPIKQLWPKGVLGRYMHFNDTFHDLRKTIFDAYEENEGDYHGADEDPDDEDDSGDEEKQIEVDLECDKDFL